MTAGDTSLLGYIFVILGLAFVAIGVAVYLNIHGTKQPSQTAAGSPPTRGNQSLSISPVDSKRITEPSGLPYSQSDGEKMGFSAADKITNQNNLMGVKTVSLINSNQPDSHEDKITASKTSADGEEYQHIATFYREETTGRLLIRMGDRKFSSPSELFNSPHWSQIEKLSSDLAAWLRNAPDRRPPSPAKPPDPASGSKAALGPQSMVEQINQILERKLATLEGEQRAVRLLEGPRGDVRVLIGVESFAINEVPYEGIRRLIREAVNEWEKG